MLTIIGDYGQGKISGYSSSIASSSQPYSRKKLICKRGLKSALGADTPTFDKRLNTGSPIK
jgi:hypothetical protein